MPNDAYEQSGLYSHQGSSSTLAARFQQRLKQQQHKPAAVSAAASADTASKRWKKNSTELPSSISASGGDLTQQHRTASFSRTNSNTSNSSGSNSAESSSCPSNNNINTATPGRSDGIGERVPLSVAANSSSVAGRSFNSSPNIIGSNISKTDRSLSDIKTSRTLPLREISSTNKPTPHGQSSWPDCTEHRFGSCGVVDDTDCSGGLSSNVILLSDVENCIKNSLVGSNPSDRAPRDAVLPHPVSPSLAACQFPSTTSTTNTPGSVPQSVSTTSANINVAVSPTLTTTTTTTTANMLPPDASSAECGILTCRPALIQRLATIKVFVLLLSLLVTVQQAVASGYLNSVITTLEKRYEVPSYITGLISSMYEIGNVSTVIFVSYLGSSRHIPVWIAIGCVAMGTGSLLFVGPQLMMDRWSMEGPGSNSTNSSSICTAATVHHQPIDQLPELGFPKLPRLGSSSSSGNCPANEAEPSQMTPILLFIAGQLLLGAGGSPLLTLGTTYIDDHVRRQDSSLYIGIIYTMGAFGPVLGFLIGGYLLSFYVDTYFIPEEQIRIDRSHPRWIGMWWAGFLIGSIALFVLSVPFIMFPKKLMKEREKVRLQEKKTLESVKGHKRSKSETSTCSRVSRTSLASRRMYGKDVRDIPACLLKLLLNPIYFMTCLAACMELIIVSGFIVFLPKYLETQFSLSNVQASVFTGGVAIPGACVGTFLGGYLLKRFSLKPKGAVQMLMICNLIGLSLYGLFFVLGCDNVKMAGTTSPYFNRTAGRFSSAELHTTPATASILSVAGSATLPTFMSPLGDAPVTPSLDEVIASSSYFSSGGGQGLLSSGGGGFAVNLTSWCNTGCECSHRLAEPVCGNNGLTYFSPCHAGCTAASPSSFTNCTCIDSVASADPSAESFAEVVAVPVATAGPCYIPCNTFMPFMVVLFLMCASVATSQMPLLMIVLRSVSEEERALALGLQFVMYRLIAYIPAPIMFGSVIDSTCLMWTSSCGAGRCLMYDIEQFRFRYVGICASIKVIAAAIFVFDWLLIRWQYRLDMAGTLSVGDIVNSLRSVDRGGDDEADDLQTVNSGGNFRSSFTSSAASVTNNNNPQYHLSSNVGGPGSPYNSSGGGAGVGGKPPVGSGHKPGHKRSQSGCPAGSGPWLGGGGGGGGKHHRRSHSSSSPPAGILANLPGHVRRPSAGYQVTFRDVSSSGGAAAPPSEELAQLERLLPEGAEGSGSHLIGEEEGEDGGVTVQAQLEGVTGVRV